MSTENIHFLPFADRREIIAEAVLGAMRGTIDDPNPLALEIVANGAKLTTLEGILSGDEGPQGVNAAFSSSDLREAAGEAIEQLFLELAAKPPEHRVLLRPVPLPDFRQTALPRAEAGDLQPKPEGTEAREVKMSILGESATLATYAGVKTIFRELVINSDWNAIAVIVFEMVQAAYRVERDALIAVLNANAELRDGTALFDSSRGNDVTFDTSFRTTVNAANNALRALKSKHNANLQTKAAVLAVPTTHELDADVLELAERSDLEVFADSRLSHGYLFPSPDQRPVIALGTLAGNPMPEARTIRRFSPEGWGVRVQHFATVVPVSWYAVRFGLS